MKKTLTVLLALVLVIVMSVAGTMAYLTDSASVTNTFTVGKVAITLDETKVDEYGKEVPNADGRVTQNAYKLIPGQTYTKDPIVHFQPESEASWLFVKLENGIASYQDNPTIERQITDNGWEELTGVPGVYYRAVNANTGTTAIDYPVFQNFTIRDTAAPAGTPTVTVTAYAIQRAGIDTAADAWAKVGT